MWNDKQNAADHHADLIRVRDRVASEKLQYQKAGQIGSTQDMKDYRLKTLDALIKIAFVEMGNKPSKTRDEFYR